MLSSGGNSASKQQNGGTKAQEAGAISSMRTTDGTQGVTPDSPLVANGTNQYSTAVLDHSFSKHDRNHLQQTGLENNSPSQLTEFSADVGSRDVDSRPPSTTTASNKSDIGKKKGDKLLQHIKASSAVSKLDALTPTTTPDSKRKAEKPSRRALKLGSSSSSAWGGRKDAAGSDSDGGVTGCTLMSPDNAPSMGCFGCISRKGELFN